MDVSKLSAKTRKQNKLPLSAFRPSQGGIFTGLLQLEPLYPALHFSMWKCLNEWAFGTHDFCASYGHWVGQGHGMAEKGFKPHFLEDCFELLLQQYCALSCVGSVTSYSSSSR